ncbi:hypothetical protein DJ93_781 [Bacillus clarus]|uniref:Uncharacterized protein n=1 Tax=Bacillus clarus TaxID=2338372 RepID=A0A090YY94_9BACI|nr:hypothetical protein DJ93_781 [Bacillus clarus]
MNILNSEGGNKLLNLADNFFNNNTKSEKNTDEK